MKRILRYLLLAVAALPVTACDDFFNTDPDTLINVDEYIGDENEMYRGYLGIITRMQNAGDHAIFLTDTRCNFLETAPNAPVALQDIYAYKPTDGNEYADPSCYYEIVVACNDYLAKMEEYIQKVGAGISEVGAANFPCLISSALRIKVWAYYMLGSIYGEAYWFDDPLEEMKNLDDSSIFTHLTDMRAIVDRCVALLDNGIDLAGEHYAADLDMNLSEWIDPENNDNDRYEYWDYFTPPFLILRAELVSWRGEQADWIWIKDNILQFLYMIYGNNAGYIPHNGPSPITTPDYPDYTNSNNIGEAKKYYACTIPNQHSYYMNFFNEEPAGSVKYMLICGLMYDYDNHQRNRIVQYFCPAYPGDGFYLQPSQYGISQYSETDIRGLTQQQTMYTINGSVAFTKYYYSREGGLSPHYLRTKIFEIEPIIPLFRGHDLHFLLAEAENHLGNWHPAKVLLNNGLENEFPDRGTKPLPDDWDSRYLSWFGTGGGYGNIGIAGMALGNEHPLPVPDGNGLFVDDEGNTYTEQERMKAYDLALADEYLLEYTGEGKAYSYLCKMAERYGDPDIVADRVAPKYSDAMQADVRASIATDGYFIKWNLAGE